MTADCDSRWAHLLKDISKQLLPSTQCGAEPFFFQLQLLQNPRGILLDSWVTAFRQIYGYLSHSAQKRALDAQKVTLETEMTASVTQTAMMTPHVTCERYVDIEAASVNKAS